MSCRTVTWWSCTLSEQAKWITVLEAKIDKVLWDVPPIFALEVTNNAILLRFQRFSLRLPAFSSPTYHRKVHFALVWWDANRMVHGLTFFQALLTAGYAYAYWLLGRLRDRLQGIVHLILLGVSLSLLLVAALAWP